MSTSELLRPLDGYLPLGAAWDEMVDRDHRVREHWVRLAQVLDGMGTEGLCRRLAETDRLLDADGVTYTVSTPDGPRSQRWQLDPIPLLLTSEEWAGVERGVIERAEVLNLVLADLYGERTLLRRGLLPPELVFAHPGFRRECDGITIPGPQQLFMSAVDLARCGDGSFQVLADRTQSPSGAGYVLENRTVVSRVLPSVYRDADVHRVAPFFRSMRAGLQRVAPPGVDDPRIVVLSPGPYSETAFEHAHLATYLGYPLVEGADLVMRDGRVWMRALKGLEPVHVILRRVDAWYCDPLELKPDSYLGVAGLVEATRRGTVSVVNTLGSGVLENPGLLAFLPTLARHLLGTPLQLEAVPTWWCGDPIGRSHVLANLPRLVIKPIARSTGPLAVFGWELSSSELDEVRRRIEARPHAWVGQERVEPGSAPTLLPDGRIEARPTVLRAFTVATVDSYTVLAGGLTRVGSSPDAIRISNQSGALTKDTWVLASEPELLSGFWLHEGPAAAAAEPSAMSPRAAENLFWLGRYTERAEAAARLLRVTLDRQTDFQHGLNPAGLACLHALLEALTHVTTTYPGFVGEGARERIAAPGAEIVSLATARERPGSLAHAVHHALDAAVAVRDQLSLDTWLVVGSLDAALADLAQPSDDRQLDLQRSLRQVMHGLLALHGLAAESMVRDPGWRLMDAGRRIERALQLTALLRATMVRAHGTAIDSLLYESVLIALESIVTYRRRYRSQAHAATLLDLVLTDGANPRSLAYQLAQLQEDLAALPDHDRTRLSPADRLVLQCATDLRLVDTETLATLDGDGGRPALDAFLRTITDRLRAAADALRDQHFPPSLPQRALTEPPGLGGGETLHMDLA